MTDSEGAVSSVATVSITIINDPPVANPQSVELPPNTSKAVTLTGSDNCNDPLTYAVLTQPAHGVLTGTAPNLTYTPATDYTGADSFTFKVNDGANDSPAATVTLNVAQWQTWTNIAPGNWSAGTNWSGGTAPAAGGGTTGTARFQYEPLLGHQLQRPGRHLPTQPPQPRQRPAGPDPQRQRPLVHPQQRHPAAGEPEQRQRGHRF